MPIKINISKHIDQHGVPGLQVDLSNHDQENNSHTIVFVPGNIRWENIDFGGYSFKVGFNGDLTVTKTIVESDSDLQIDGANEVYIIGQEFQQLKINAKSVDFSGCCIVDNLQIYASYIKNNGTLSSNRANLKASISFDNSNGVISADQTVTLETAFLNNCNGKILGKTGTTIKGEVTIDQDIHSVIGATGATTISYDDNLAVEHLGTINGDKIHLINPPTVKLSGYINGLQEVVLASPEQSITMPHVEIKTPILQLQTKDFHLGSQAECDRTILATKIGSSITLKHAYRTAGTFELQEEADLKAGCVVPAKYTVEFQTTLQAAKGFKARCPNGKLLANNPDPNILAEFIMKDGMLDVVANEIDFSQSCVEALDVNITSPNIVKIGALIEHASKKVVSTFYCHAYVATTHCLGNNIKPVSYKCLDKESAVYDGRHLLVMPFITRNASTWNIKNTTTINGALHLYGKLTTKDLIINSPTPSLIHAGFLNVAHDFVLNGTLQLQRVKSDFRFIYVGRHDLIFTFCNSDAAILDVHRKISGNATIINEGCDFNPPCVQSPEVKIDAKSFISTMRQDVIDGTAQEIAEITTKQWRVLNGRIWGGFEVPYPPTPVPITTPSGRYDDQQIDMGYCAGFLVATNNFVNSVQEFKAKIGSPKEMLVTVHNTSFTADLATPMALILTDGNVTLFKSSVTNDLSHPVNLPGPNRNLSQAPFNTYEIKVAEDLPQQITANAAKPSLDLYYKIHERAWFDSKESDKFYSPIMEHIVLVKRDGRLSKPGIKTVIFDLSVAKLIERAREQCRAVLGRIFMYAHQPMDEAFLQETHVNTSEFIREHNLDGPSFIQILDKALLNPKTAPRKPMLYYACLLDDQGLEILFPILYVPVDLILQVHQRNNPGGLLLANTAFIVSNSLTPQEMLTYAGNIQALIRDKLDNFFTHNPVTTRLIHDQAMQAKQQIELAEQSSQAIVPNLPKVEHVQIYGNINVVNFGSMIAGDSIIYADIKAQDALIMALMGDVTIESLKERCGDQQSFHDKLHLARVSASNILKLVSGGNIIFKGAETHGGLINDMLALKAIIDVPVDLQYQRIEKFYSKNSETTRISIGNIPSVSKHSSNNTVNMNGEDGVFLCASEVESLEFKIKSKNGKGALTEAIQTNIVQEQTITEKDSFLLGSTTEVSYRGQGSRSSVGAKLKVKNFTMACKDGVALQNITSSAELNDLSSTDGPVDFLLGHNHSTISSSKSKSNMWWQRNSSQRITSDTFSSSKFKGPVKVTANQVTLEQIRGTTLSFLNNLEVEQGRVAYRTLDEYIHHESNAVEGPGPATLAIVAVAVTVATYGTGSGWAATTLGFAETTAVNAVIAAGFANICSQYAVSLLNSNADPIAAIKGLANSKAVESLATAMITAGLMSEVSDSMNLPKYSQRTLLDHAKYNISRASISATINILRHGQDLDKALIDGIIDAATSTATAAIVTQTPLLSAHDSSKVAATKIALVQASISALEGSFTSTDAAMVAAIQSITSGVVGYIADTYSTASCVEQVSQAVYDAAVGEEEKTSEPIDNSLAALSALAILRRRRKPGEVEIDELNIEQHKQNKQNKLKDNRHVKPIIVSNNAPKTHTVERFIDKNGKVLTVNTKTKQFSQSAKDLALRSLKNGERGSKLNIYVTNKQLDDFVPTSKDFTKIYDVAGDNQLQMGVTGYAYYTKKLYNRSDLSDINSLEHTLESSAFRAGAGILLFSGNMHTPLGDINIQIQGPTSHAASTAFIRATPKNISMGLNLGASIKSLSLRVEHSGSICTPGKEFCINFRTAFEAARGKGWVLGFGESTVNSGNIVKTRNIKRAGLSKFGLMLAGESDITTEMRGEVMDIPCLPEPYNWPAFADIGAGTSYEMSTNIFAQLKHTMLCELKAEQNKQTLKKHP